jgi:predicted ATPase
MSVCNYKAIKEATLDLGRFNVLVGANSTGKSTFMDVFAFIKDCVDKTPEEAVLKRVPNYNNLTHFQSGEDIETTLLFDLSSFGEQHRDYLYQYTLVIGLDGNDEIIVKHEELGKHERKLLAFDADSLKWNKKTSKKLLGKTSGGKNSFKRENTSYTDSFVYGAKRTSLGNLPKDEFSYPTAWIIRNIIVDGIQRYELEVKKMMEPSLANAPSVLLSDGSNLSKVIGKFINTKEEDDIEDWLDLLRLVLPDLKEVHPNKRESDNAEYISLSYNNGLTCPSWLLSEGTLRLLAFTVLPFLDEKPSLYFVEEPENGIHPKGIEIVIRSFNMFRFSQVFVTTHSPVVVAQSGIEPLLCFTNHDGGVNISRAINNKRLKDYKGEPSLDVMYANSLLNSILTDLLIHCPDADIEKTIGALLKRFQALGIRQISCEFNRNSYKDSGVINDGIGLIKSKMSEFNKSILICDHWGTQKSEPSVELEEKLENEMSSESFCARVLDTVLEELFWNDLNGIRLVIAEDTDLQSFKDKAEHIFSKYTGEKRFENAFKDLLKQTNRRDSPRLYEKISEKSNLSLWCQNRAFKKFVTKLRQWFPPENQLTNPVDC